MSRNHLKFNILLLTLFMPVLFSCDPGRIFDEHQQVKNSTWNVKNDVQFDVLISDLLARYNVYLSVRNGPEYPYSNLYLFMNTVFPDGYIARDTIELTLADYDGRWLGAGMGSTKFSKFLLQKNLQFKQSGRYKFVLQQAMRENELKGIHDVGLRIEKQ